MSTLVFEEAFRYVTNLKLSKLKTEINSIFPNGEDLTITSKSFSQLESVAQSCTSLNEQIVKSLNESIQEDRYYIRSDINPKYSSEENELEWNDNEVAKVWIIDKIYGEKNPSSIRAISLTQITQFTKDEAHLLN